jgi:hypothetical protein
MSTRGLPQSLRRQLAAAHAEWASKQPSTDTPEQREAKLTVFLAEVVAVIVDNWERARIDRCRL